MAGGRMARLGFEEEPELPAWGRCFAPKSENVVWRLLVGFGAKNTAPREKAFAEQQISNRAFGVIYWVGLAVLAIGAYFRDNRWRWFLMMVPALETLVALRPLLEFREQIRNSPLRQDLLLVPITSAEYVDAFTRFYFMAVVLIIPHSLAAYMGARVGASAPEIGELSFATYLTAFIAIVSCIAILCMIALNTQFPRIIGMLWLYTLCSVWISAHINGFPLWAANIAYSTVCVMIGYPSWKRSRTSFVPDVLHSLNC